MQYLMEGAVKGKQLLRVMQLDRLDSRNEPVPDGQFDFVEGYTMYSSTGGVIFPVVEPFGEHLRKMIANDVVVSANEVTLNKNHKVVNIQNGTCKVGEDTFTFSVYTNINGMAENLTEELMLDITAPARIDGRTYVLEFISYIETNQ